MLHDWNEMFTSWFQNRTVNITIRDDCVDYANGYDFYNDAN